MPSHDSLQRWLMSEIDGLIRKSYKKRKQNSSMGTKRDKTNSSLQDRGKAQGRRLAVGTDDGWSLLITVGKSVTDSDTYPLS